MLQLTDHRGDRQAGQALVEFALVIPIFLLITFAIIQFGLLLGAQNSLTSAVRETARYAAPYRVVDAAGAASTCQIAQQKLSDALRSNPLTGDPATREVATITYTWKQDPNNQWYVEIKVQADYKAPLYVPLVSIVLDGLDGTVDQSLRISAQEEMRVENTALASSDTTTSCT